MTGQGDSYLFLIISFDRDRIEWKFVYIVKLLEGRSTKHRLRILRGCYSYLLVCSCGVGIDAYSVGSLAKLRQPQKIPSGLPLLFACFHQ